MAARLCSQSRSTTSQGRARPRAYSPRCLLFLEYAQGDTPESEAICSRGISLLCCSGRSVLRLRKRYGKQTNRKLVSANLHQLHFTPNTLVLFLHATKHTIVNRVQRRLRSA